MVPPPALPLASSVAVPRTATVSPLTLIFPPVLPGARFEASRRPETSTLPPVPAAMVMSPLTMLPDCAMAMPYMSPATRVAFGAEIVPLLVTPGLETTRAFGIAAAVPTNMFPSFSPTYTLPPAARVTLPFCEVMTPWLLTCAPYSPTSFTAMMLPRFSTSPVRPVKFIRPARKSEFEICPAPAMIPPTFTTAPLPK